MKRLLLLGTLAAAGGGLMAMSAAHAAAFTPVRSTAEATPVPSIGSEPEAPFQMPKQFMYPQQWIIFGKQTASQAYGSPAVGVPMRLTQSLDQPATGGTTAKGTLFQKLLANPTCPPVLATCTTMWALTGKEPVATHAYPGEEVLDLAIEVDAPATQQKPIDLEKGMDWQYWMQKAVKAWLGGTQAVRARLASLETVLDLPEGGAR
jgi:hypothetical protein